MKVSQYFLPTLKETPSEAQVTSHKLMLRAGLICQETSGIYSWLPLGLRTLKKIERVVREEQNKAECLEVLLPIVQTADLWKESGRYEAYGKEMLRFVDRHERELLFGPTAEEVIFDIFRRYVRSYQDLPKCFYQIQWKFRDEIRPRFGVMRGREFLMKDAYSFDLDQASAVETYKKMMRAYLNTFKRLDMVAIPIRADTGPIGGDLSHEFHVFAETGESKIYYDKRYDAFKSRIGEVGVEELMSLYATTEDMHDPETCGVSPSELKETRGIEMGHIFYYGDKYSQKMNVKIMNQAGEMIYPHGGCYGIGVTRLMAALIETHHDAQGIVWPQEVAPFAVALINLKTNDDTCNRLADEVYAALQDEGIEVLYEDSSQSAGTKFANMDLIGIPLQIIVGPRSSKDNKLEIKIRASGEKQEMEKEAALAYVFQLSLSKRPS